MLREPLYVSYSNMLSDRYSESCMINELYIV